MAELTLLECLKCGANLKGIKPNETFPCPNCGKPHFLEANTLKEIDQPESKQVIHQPEADHAKKEENKKTHPVFSFLSVIYIILVCFLGIATIFEYHTVIFLHILTGIFSLFLGYVAVYNSDKDYGVSDSLGFAMCVWIVSNIILIILGFNLSHHFILNLLLSFLLQLIIPFVLLVVGVLIAITIHPDLKKQQ